MENIEKEKLSKKERNKQKNIEKQNNIKELNKKNKIEKENTLKWIKNKMDKMENFKLQKQLISERKRKIRDDIIKKKEEYDEEFKKMFHKKNIDNKMIKNIIKMFPNNVKINSLLKRLKELDEEERKEIAKSEEKRKAIEIKLKNEEKKYQDFLNSQKNFRRNNTESNRFKKRDFNIKNDIESEENKRTMSFHLKEKNNDNKFFTFGIKENNNNSKNLDNIQKKNNISHNKNNKKKLNKKRPNTSINSKKNIKNIQQKLNIKTVNTSNSSKKNITLKSIKQNYKKNNKLNSTNLKTHRIQSQNNNNNYNSKTYPNDKIEKKIKMEKKLNEYKVQLSNKLIQLITEEKKKEIKRIYNYNKITDPNEKELFMKELLDEKTKSEILISEMNDEILKKYKKYENSLKNQI